MLASTFVLIPALFIDHPDFFVTEIAFSGKTGLQEIRKVDTAVFQKCLAVRQFFPPTPFELRGRKFEEDIRRTGWMGGWSLVVHTTALNICD